MGTRVDWTSEEEQRLRDLWDEYVREEDRGSIADWQVFVSGVLNNEYHGCEPVRTDTAVKEKRHKLDPPLKLDQPGAQPQAAPAENPKRHGILDELDDLDLQDYTYIESDDKYLFSVAGKVLPLPGTVWRYICREYSTEGADKTAKEISREIELPVGVVKALLKQADQFKASLPFSREEMLERPVDELADAMIATKERQVVAKYERRKRVAWEREVLDLKQWKLSDDRFNEAAAQITGDRPVPEPPAVKRNGTADTFVAHAPTTDEHIGLLVRGDEIGPDGANYDTTIACARLRSHADRMAEWVAGQPGRCSDLYRTYLGDLLHAITGGTEHGTKLHQDSRTTKVWDAALEAVEYSVQRGRQVADHVHVFYAPGNHDGRDEIHKFFRTLQRTFRDVDDVTVNVDPARFVAFRVADTLHLLDHGYGVGSLNGWKAKAQAELTARQVGGEMFVGAEWIYTYVGHLHEWAGGSFGAHHKIVRLEALTNPDDYATDLRFAHGPGARFFRLDDQGRIATERVVYVDELAPVS